MSNVLITGSNGFIGQNLKVTLEGRDQITITELTRETPESDIEGLVKNADFIFHIAGINRPKDEKEFITGNTDLTQKIVTILQDSGKKTPILVTSSAQAELDNSYGKSKAAAEKIVFDYADKSDASVYLYRLPGVFGKWSRPNYNTVVATFCYNTIHGIDISVSDPAHELTLVYIDDVIEDFLKAYDQQVKPAKDGFCYVDRVFHPTLGELKSLIEQYHNSRSSLVMPSLEGDFERRLYATFLSFLSEDDFSYELTLNSDERGWLAEFIKSEQFGQIFVSKTKPGISRGNHWHHTKIEKFLVIEGEGEIAFRSKIGDQKVFGYNVSGDTPTVVDIPVGYVHSITNSGKSDLITLFWASEILDKEKPDTIFEPVHKEESKQ